MASSSKKANGNINVSTFVKFDPNNDNQILQSTATSDNMFGVSGSGPRVFPLTLGSTTLYDGFAAIAGEDCEVFGIGEVCLLRVGGTVSPGNYLTADSSGRGIAASTGNHYGAQAEEAGTIDQLIRVRVLQGTL